MERYLIAGLGNPDKKYEGTRHNTGFMAIDRLAEKLGCGIREKRFKGLCGECMHNGKKVLLLKPLTYMNLSGQAVRAAAEYYDIPADHVVILVDDINFECGRMRVRGSGSAGGHNGLKSIIADLGSDQFVRIRIGVGGLRQDEDLISHVLGGFSRADREIMDKVFSAAADAALLYMDQGLTETMNRYNGLNLAPAPAEPVRKAEEKQKTETSEKQETETPEKQKTETPEKQETETPEKQKTEGAEKQE